MAWPVLGLRHVVSRGTAAAAGTGIGVAGFPSAAAAAALVFEGGGEGGGGRRGRLIVAVGEA